MSVADVFATRLGLEMVGNRKCEYVRLQKSITATSSSVSNKFRLKSPVNITELISAECRL